MPPRLVGAECNDLQRPIVCLIQHAAGRVGVAADDDIGEAFAFGLSITIETAMVRSENTQVQGEQNRHDDHRHPRVRAQNTGSVAVVW
ncbi:hypothetical protein MesoLj131b_17700 [Mesorhizobium sp. 131-2-5]|nr:hypothetical protein MesoLj131b_17700 [Mesorhizobium sp. 131-2-5]